MNQKLSIEWCKQIAVREAVRYLKPIVNKPMDDVLRDFIASETYDLIMDSATRMWAESGGYLGDWYLEEKAREAKQAASGGLLGPASPGRKARGG